MTIAVTENGKMTKLYVVELNSKGAPDFSTAKECILCWDCRYFCELLPGTEPICLKYGSDFKPKDYCSKGAGK